MEKFSRIYVEISNICNLSCSFCVGNSRPLHSMTTEEFTHIMREIKPRTDHIYLHVLGEPLAHPLLGEFLRIAHEFAIKVNITTNGTLLPRRQDVLLASPALRKVSVSLHSLETDDEAECAHYLQGVADFVTEALKKNIICELKFWNLGVEGIENERMLTTLCNHLGITPEKQLEAEGNLDQTGCTTLRPRLFLGKAERFSWPSLDAPLTESGVFCYGLRNHAAILCDGTVVPCCLDSCGDVNLGNVLNTPLEEILAGERARALYEGFSNRRPSEELCKRCGYATRF